MKMRLLSLFLMVIMVVSVVQPTFAVQLWDTKITGPDGEPLKDITVPRLSPIELQARLYYNIGLNDWEALAWRYLDFYVYKSNVDGSNGDLIYHEKAATNLFTKNANPERFCILTKGTYNLVVIYEGDLQHCNGTAKIYVS